MHRTSVAIPFLHDTAAAMSCRSLGTEHIYGHTLSTCYNCGNVLYIGHRTSSVAIPFLYVTTVAIISTCYNCGNVLYIIGHRTSMAIPFPHVTAVTMSFTQDTDHQWPYPFYMLLLWQCLAYIYI